MKRIICLILTLLTIFSFFGCDNSDQTAIIENDDVLSSAQKGNFGEIIIGNEVNNDNSSFSSSYSSENNSCENSDSSSSKHEEPSSSSESTGESKPASTYSNESSKSGDESNSAAQEGVNNTVASPNETRAIWISYLEFQSILQGKSKSQFTNSIKEVFSNIYENGFNTVYVHVRSHSDAMYKSNIYPWSVYCTGTEGVNPGFDPLKIMVKEAHTVGLRIEAWINPYRVKSSNNTSKISKNSPAYRWLNTDKVVILNGKGIFYNPADEEVIDLIVGGVEEIVANYNVDGIHFDDYFYPTTDYSFDKSYYEKYKSGGGTENLESWRRHNVNTLIERVYASIKALNSSCRFGVSPAGNMDQNYNTLYCDVKTWVSNSGYVDYICPQIYFGFNNKSRAYLLVLDEFSRMITNKNIELIVGLSAYKIGTEDTYAGESGKTEWQNNDNILSRQVIAARKENSYSGFALYRYDSIFNPTKSVEETVKTELKYLKDIF